MTLSVSPSVRDRIAALRGAVWDLDNTLYQFTAAQEQAFNIAVARAALDWGVDMTLDEAIALAEQSYATHRYSGFEFMTRYNIANRDIHHLTDRYMDHTMIDKCIETRDLFARSTTANALVTHSARPWALNVLARLELSPWFPEKQVFAFENYDFESKAQSRKPFEMALAALNLNPGDVMMVEDTLDNLRIPHDMGMMTVYLHHGRPADDLPDFVDHRARNVRDLLNCVYSSASL